MLTGGASNDLISCSFVRPGYVMPTDTGPGQLGAVPRPPLDPHYLPETAETPDDLASRIL